MYSSAVPTDSRKLIESAWRLRTTSHCSSSRFVCCCGSSGKWYNSQSACAPPWTMVHVPSVAVQLGLADKGIRRDLDDTTKICGGVCEKPLTSLIVEVNETPCIVPGLSAPAHSTGYISLLPYTCSVAQRTVRSTPSPNMIRGCHPRTCKAFVISAAI